MIIKTEQEMIDFGRKIGQKVQLPAVFELIGDVGAGKTTFTRGLAQGLGVDEQITSPSFTISKRYGFKRDDNAIGELSHYDFYRLDDPGLMYEELAETLAQPNSVVVVEWGADVVDLFPEQKHKLTITLQEDGSRIIELDSRLFKEEL